MGPWLGYYVCLVPSFDLETYCRVGSFPEGYDPGLILSIQLLQDKRATMARLVPPVALALAENPVVQKYSYPDLEYFSCSAAPLKVCRRTLNIISITKRKSP